MTEQTVQQRARQPRRQVVGEVIAAQKTPKTIRVRMAYQVAHPTYGKIVQRSTTLHVHDEKAEAKVGDKVQVMECRPISKTKTWRLVKVLEHGK